MVVGGVPDPNRWARDLSLSGVCQAHDRTGIRRADQLRLQLAGSKAGAAAPEGRKETGSLASSKHSQWAELKLLIKRRYRHTDPDTGERLETRHHPTAEAAASPLIDLEPIVESHEALYVSDNPNDPPFGPNFAMAPKR
jgi:hypothetical protein